MRRGAILVILGALGLTCSVISTPALGELGPCSEFMSGDCWCKLDNQRYCYCEQHQFQEAKCANTNGTCPTFGQNCFDDMSTNKVCCGTEITCAMGCMILSESCGYTNFKC